MEEGKLPALRERLNGIAAEWLDEEALQGELELDCECSLSEINSALMGPLERMQPFGLKNPRPLFAARGCRILPGTRAVGADGTHLKLSVGQGPLTFQGIAFRQAAAFKLLDSSKPVDLAFSPDWNVYNGSKSLQLDVKEIRASA
jgi:single-stranded-DNA-specific exonuclease